jgi:hypothetical protein
MVVATELFELYSFDGTNWTKLLDMPKYSIPLNGDLPGLKYVAQIAFDESNNFWVCGYGHDYTWYDPHKTYYYQTPGLYLYDGNSWKAFAGVENVNSILLRGNMLFINGYSSTGCSEITEKYCVYNGNVMEYRVDVAPGYVYGLFGHNLIKKYINDQWQTVADMNDAGNLFGSWYSTIVSFAVGRNRIWTAGTGITGYSDSNWTLVKNYDDFRAGLQQINSIAIDRDGNKWFYGEKVKDENGAYYSPRPRGLFRLNDGQDSVTNGPVMVLSNDNLRFHHMNVLENQTVSFDVRNIGIDTLVARLQPIKTGYL